MSETPDLDQTVVSVSNNPSMPASWESSDSGTSWEWGNYYLVLQKNPRMAIMKVYGNKAPAQLKAMASRLRYFYALFVYYKPGKNPSGKDSFRPCEVLTMESVDGDGPNFCSFLPTMRCNHGAGFDDKSMAVTQFFDYLRKTIPGEPVRIGDMMEVHRRLNPEAHDAMVAQQGKSGCLVMLAAPFLLFELARLLT